jgi:hypothetical protein
LIRSVIDLVFTISSDAGTSCAKSKLPSIFFK